MTEFTGERVVPGQVDDDLWAEHLSRYAFAARYASGRRVLDIGCGAGYGTAELAQHASQATGIDIAPDAIEYARAEYPLANVRFLTGSAASLPFDPGSFDLVTAFEVIEHLDDWNALLAEARRVLSPTGMLLVSTPNRLYYNEARGREGPNPFHTHEFEFEEFRAALAQHFPHCAVLLQNRMESIAFYPHATFLPVEARLDSSRGNPQEAHFFLGIGSIAAPVELRSFVFVPRASNQLREREHHIRSLDRQLAEVRAEFAQLLASHESLQRHLEEKNEWGRNQNREIETARQRLSALQQEFEERTAWAKKLDAQVTRFESSRWVRLGRKLGRGAEFDEASPAKGS